MKLEELEKKIYVSNNEDLITFINENFFRNDSLDEDSFKENVDNLSSLDGRTINIALARMSSIKENNNTAGWLGGFITLVVALLAALNSFLSNVDSHFSSVLYLITVLIIYLILIFQMKKSKDKRIIALYFSELLMSVKK